jgi:hypothetical protein
MLLDDPTGQLDDVAPLCPRWQPDQEFVPHKTVEAVLKSMAVADAMIADAADRVSVSTAGHFAQGILLGHADSPRPSTSVRPLGPPGGLRALPSAIGSSRS